MLGRKTNKKKKKKEHQFVLGFFLAIKYQVCS